MINVKKGELILLNADIKTYKIYIVLNDINEIRFVGSIFESDFSDNYVFRQESKVELYANELEEIVNFMNKLKD